MGHRTSPQVSFTIDQEYVEQLDELARAGGVSRSAAARMLIYKGLGVDHHEYVAREAMYGISTALQQIRRKLEEQCVDELPRIMSEVFGKTEDK